LYTVEQQPPVDGVALSEVLPSHSVEVSAAEALELFSSEVVNGVQAVRRLARDAEDDVEHIAVGPAAWVKSLPVLLTAAAFVQIIVCVQR